MRGNFDKIIGKTIKHVYCRDNEQAPRGQIFLVFDDDTNFEIYAESGLRGCSGPDGGGLQAVLSRYQPRGKGELFE